MAVQYAPTKLRVPPGFQNLLEGLAREVLREQPDDIIQFGAQYFKNQLAIREETGKDDAKRGNNLEKLMKGDEVDIDIDDPEVQKAATKIQASFRGHKTREDIKQKKDEEGAALKIQSSFRGHKAREEVKQLKESKSRESTEAGSPVKDAASDEKEEAKEEKEKEEEVDIDLNDPDVQGAALKIQASFRGHKAREEVKKTKSGESLPSEGDNKEAAPETEAASETAAAEPEAAVTEPEAAETEAVVAETDAAGPAKSEEEEVDIDLDDPEVQNAALKIQASFRSHKSRESVKSAKDEEAQQQDAAPTADDLTPAADDSAVVADDSAVVADDSAVVADDSAVVADDSAAAEAPSQEAAGDAPTGDVAAENAEEIDIDLNDPEVNKAATKIQATFRGHKSRKEKKEGDSPSESGTSIQTPVEGSEEAAEGGEAPQEESAPADAEAPATQEHEAAGEGEQQADATEGEGAAESAEAPTADDDAVKPEEPSVEEPAAEEPAAEPVATETEPKAAQEES